MNARNNFEYFTDERLRSLPKFESNEYRTPKELATLIKELLDVNAWTSAHDYSLQLQEFKEWVLPFANSREFAHYRKRYDLTYDDVFTCAYDYLILRRKLEKFNLEKPETFKGWVYVALRHSVQEFVKKSKTRGEYNGSKKGKKEDGTQREKYAECQRRILKEKQDAAFSLDLEEPELPFADDAPFEPSPERPLRPIRDAFAHYQRANPVTAYIMAARLSGLNYNEILNVLAPDLKYYAVRRQCLRGYLAILTYIFKKGCISPKTFFTAKKKLTSSPKQSRKNR